MDRGAQVALAMLALDGNREHLFATVWAGHHRRIDGLPVDRRNLTFVPVCGFEVRHDSPPAETHVPH
jgi:hypothetical protein